MMLSLFSNLLSKEDDRRVIDNLCAALCRMITSNVEIIPLEQVIPALVGRLPLEEDLEENKTVYGCLSMLYTHSPGLIVSQMKQIVAASTKVLGTKDVDEETRNHLGLLLSNFAQQHPANFQAAVTSLPAEQQAALSAAITPS
ncbi:hypothetical protein CRUP_016962 [Coryphaenoides rupestris]|nr:hypothetical protein CRUP_016962 [Coryphaenoides rupestris]